MNDITHKPYNRPCLLGSMKQKTKPKGIKNDVFIRSRVHTFKEKKK